MQPVEEGGACCAAHPTLESAGTCRRCGRFACEACAEASPCLECQSHQFQAAPRLSRGLATAIGLLLGLYAICTTLTIPATAAVDLKSLDVAALTQTPMLLILALQAVYMLGWLLLIVAFLAWYGGLVDWARHRGVEGPSALSAIGCWFVPLYNFVHPYRTTAAIQVGTQVEAPVLMWWLVYSASNVLGIVGLFRFGARGYDPILILNSALEVAAALLCWKVVSAFTTAAADWNPDQARKDREARVGAS